MHNNSFFLAHHALFLGHQYSNRLPITLRGSTTITAVDLAYLIRTCGSEVFLKAMQNYRNSLLDTIREGTGNFYCFHVKYVSAILVGVDKNTPFPSMDVVRGSDGVVAGVLRSGPTSPRLVKSKGHAVLSDSEAQEPWWCGDAHLPDMGRSTCGSARMMLGDPLKLQEFALDRKYSRMYVCRVSSDLEIRENELIQENQGK